MKQRIIILGSTGSIGQNALDVIASLGDGCTVVGLAAGSQSRQLAEQANRFRPPTLAIADSTCAGALDAALAYSPKILCGHDALEQLVETVPCDCVITAVVGTAGVAATLRAATLGRRIALANKEALVMAGAILVPLANRHEATIIPVDSEHSAIFQALRAGTPAEVRKVHLTASGGPFRTWSEEAMDEITVEDALRHPTWTMGPKITIDCATMMNKALEIIEAKWLFGLRAEQIEVVIHPESIIHSMVEFCDGSVVAQMGTPDMRTPIQYALTYPRRKACPSPPLEVHRLRSLTFSPPDPARFPALRLGYEVAKRGGTAGAVFNAANEAAVRLFREGAIHYRDIARFVERALTQHAFKRSPTWEDLQKADRWARQEVIRCTTC